MFSEFLDNQFLSIIQSLEGFSQKQDPEFIHQIRVGIKKIRAVYSFIKKTTGEDSIPKKILRELFDDAGTLRELQLNISLLEGFDIPEGLVEPLKIKEKFLCEAFVLKIPAYINEVKQLEIKIPFPAIEGKVVKTYLEHII